jgi:asparagine synthase (glutamine-hydrolysing)
MTRTMEFRGPDAGSIWTNRHAGFDHHRLAVIDLVDGVQPMQAEKEERTVANLIFAGEIYNFIDLRHERVAISK